MKRRTAAKRVLVIALAVAAVALFVVAPTSLAQCPLCKTAITNSDGSVGRTLNLGILVLLVPPVTIFCTIFAVAFKSRKGREDT